MVHANLSIRESIRSSRSLHTQPHTGRQFSSGTWSLWIHDDLMKPSLTAALREVFTFAAFEERPSQSPACAHHHGTNQRAAKMDLANPSHGQCPLCEQIGEGVEASHAKQQRMARCETENYKIYHLTPFFSQFQKNNWTTSPQQRCWESIWSL